MRTRIFIKLVIAAALIIAVATLTLDFSVRRSWQASLRRQITLSLTQKAKLLAHHVANVGRPDLAREVAADALAADARATVIDASGKVLFDSEAQSAEMENHASRLEFRAALDGRVGTDIRRSHTLGVEFLYVAVPVEGGAVRLAYPLAGIRETLSEVRRTLLFSSLVAFTVAVVLASFAAQLVSRRLRNIMQFAEQISAGQLHTRIFDQSSDEIGQLATALDQTAHRLEQMFAAVESSRKELEAVLNSIEDPVLAISQEHKVLWLNRALRTVLPQARVGDSLFQVIRDPEILRCVESVRACPELCKAHVNAVAPGLVFQCTAAPMPQGAVVIVLHDLTDSERIERTRRDFIANVSHELRTPLTSIEGYTETLLDLPQVGGDEARGFLETIRRNAHRMSRLTEDLLKLARVESGEWRLEKEPIAAATVLQQAVANFKGVAIGHLLTIETSLNDRIEADPDAIQQVFANLIENAAKYSPAGSAIMLGAQATMEGEVTFYVKDSGPGIPSKHVPRLFERFYRVDKARSREAGGTGLGLAIVKHIVLNHGGRVKVKSEVGRGSTFFFSLPRAVSSTSAAETGKIFSKI